MPTPEKNKVMYGLKNVHYSVLTEGADGKITYGTPVAVPGAISVNLSSNSVKKGLAADDCEYWTAQVTSKYEGDLNMALIPDEFRADCLGEKSDADSGVRYETSDINYNRFALLFEFDGDAKKTRHVFYNCSASRPAVASNTVDPDSGPEPSTETLTVTATARPDGLLKACAKTGASAYAGWFGAVFVPAAYAADDGDGESHQGG